MFEPIAQEGAPAKAWDPILMLALFVAWYNFSRFHLSFKTRLRI